MNILIAMPTPAADDETRHPNLRDDGTYNDGTNDWYLYLCSEDVTGQYAGSKLIGTWDSDGNPQGTIDSDYINYIRPFGNAAGDATDSLDHHKWMGNAQRKLQDTPDTLPEFPEDTQPIVLIMNRWHDEAPGFEGHGWKATISFADPNRPPNARAIGIYNDQWAYQYTTGAFVLTEIGQDEDDNPIMAWQTHSPPGFATAELENWYYALLLGSEQEGRMVLPVWQESQTSYFWDKDQAPPAGDTWVDSGATVTGMAGTATLVSDTTPFSTAQAVRIDGIAMTVTQVVAGQWLVLDPYTLSPTGASIEVRA